MDVGVGTHLHTGERYDRGVGWVMDSSIDAYSRLSYISRTSCWELTCPQGRPPLIPVMGNRTLIPEFPITDVYDSGLMRSKSFWDIMPECKHVLALDDPSWGLYPWSLQITSQEVFLPVCLQGFLEMEIVIFLKKAQKRIDNSGLTSFTWSNWFDLQPWTLKTCCQFT